MILCRDVITKEMVVDLCNALEVRFGFRYLFAPVRDRHWGGIACISWPGMRKTEEGTTFLNLDMFSSEYLYVKNLNFPCNEMGARHVGVIPKHEEWKTLWKSESEKNDVVFQQKYSKSSLHPLRMHWECSLFDGAAWTTFEKVTIQSELQKQGWIV
jgi:hypothetical protein